MKNNIIIRLIKLTLNVIIGISAAPLELLWIEFLTKGKNSFELLWTIGAMISFSIIYLAVVCILNAIIHRKDTDDDLGWIITRILAPVSIFAMFIILCKMNGDGIVTSIILSIIALIPNVAFVIPFDGYSFPVKEDKKENKLDYNIKTAYIKDKFGNIKGNATTYDFGNSSYTEVKNNSGRVIEEISKNGSRTEYKIK